MQRYFKRSLIAIEASKKTKDYNSGNIVNARNWSKINTRIIFSSQFEELTEPELRKSTALT